MTEKPAGHEKLGDEKFGDDKATRHDKCPVDLFMHKIAGPWTTYILWLMRQHGALRFSAFRTHIPGISPKVLSERLKRLEADGLVRRDYVPTIPPQVSYSLTPRGEELKDILDALGATALRWDAEDAQAKQDAQAKDCGKTMLEQSVAAK